MITRRTILRAGLLAAYFSTWGWSGETAAQMPNNWIIGNQQVSLPSGNNSLAISGLPQPNDPLVATDKQYSGALPTKNQYIQTDNQNNILFFIVDGNVYDGVGYLIHKGYRTDYWNWPGDPEPSWDGVGLYNGLDSDFNGIMSGGIDLAVTPVPEHCGLWYIFSVPERHVGYPYQLYFGVLDLTEPNTNLGTTSVGQRSGRFWSDFDYIDQQGFQTVGLNSGDSPFYLHAGSSLNTTPMHDDYGYWQNERTVHLELVNCAIESRVFLFAQTAYSLAKYEVLSTGITYLGTELIEHFTTGLPASWNLSHIESAKGEIDCRCTNGVIKTAMSYNIMNGEDYSGAADLLVGEMLHTMTFDATTDNADVISSSNHVLGIHYNDQTYSTPNNTGGVLYWSEVGGVEFSPNGRYTYYFKAATTNPGTGQSPSGYFGYYDWDTDQLIEMPNILMPTAIDSKMELNVSNNGSKDALYVGTTDSNGSNWLGALLNPDTPSQLLWDPDHIAVPALTLSDDPSLLTNINGPLETERYCMIQSQVWRDPAFTANTNSECCRVLHAQTAFNSPQFSANATWSAISNPFANNAVVNITGQLTIQGGAHITGSDMTFKFVEDANLVIEQGASFECTNCTFTNACEDTRWKGIEVWGTWNQHQFSTVNYPQFQGKLVLWGSTVENAIVGMTSGSSGPSKARRGGIIQCYRTNANGVTRNTVVRNCKQGVKFYAYQNFNPNNGNPFRNFSKFEDCEFYVDQAFPVAYDFQEHVNLWRVDGIRFNACTFENRLPDVFFDDLGANPGSEQMGKGIYSLDAHYVVRNKCNSIPGQGGTCPDPRKTKFIGLDHGIHALAGQTHRRFDVDGAEFTNNIIGAFAQGVNGPKVVRSDFNIGGRNVTLTGFYDASLNLHHRGIFSTESFGLNFDWNHFTGITASTPETEGIVVGFCRGNNDMVFSNEATNVTNAFVGEGICADPTNKTGNGLVFQCNKNLNDASNIVNRTVLNSPLDEDDQTIRLNQGAGDRAADNEFDRNMSLLDFENLNADNNVINYYWGGTPTPYEPLYVTPNGVINIGAADQPLNTCKNKIIPGIGITDDDDGMILLGDHLDVEKTNYANNRYLYEQLIDGGSTDDLVEEVMESWPQDAWTLRASLLGKSPNLSIEVLVEMVNKGILPAAMVAEICIANPDATKKDGFTKWLMYEAPYPLSENLIGTIVASWDTRTFRTDLESTMAYHHGEMTQTAFTILNYYESDSTYEHTDSLRSIWQEIRTPAARYAEAMTYMKEGEYTLAKQIVEGIDDEHPKLKERELSERDRMLGLLNFFIDFSTGDRDESEFTSTEISTLVTLINGQYDRPATWAQNILCYHYGICRGPLTGGDDNTPKALPYTPNGSGSTASPTLALQPNPAVNWSAINLDMKGEPLNAYIVVHDITGREITILPVLFKAGQLVLDTRTFSVGTYSVDLVNGGTRIASQKLVVQP